MDNYELQKTSIWKFPDRGSWATHKGDYRGNWSPHIPKNLLLKYTKSEDLVLDPFVGSGTTLIECKILNRNAFGIDINPNALQISKDRLNFDVLNNSYQNLFLGNATSFSFIKDSTIDFICTHPPYADIIHYSDNLENDLSLLNYQDFIKELKKVSKELHRVLKQCHYCSFMIG
ncbi:MAG: class I SAM-dependent methyltransferase, partial [Bacilli bacterium]